jgi:hypothetical protein|tara:strand:- start:1500 stop:1661 length:162 start_codon:yes stop_codon:yes gene_type:complete
MTQLSSGTTLNQKIKNSIYSVAASVKINGGMKFSSASLYALIAISKSIKTNYV